MKGAANRTATIITPLFSQLRHLAVCLLLSSIWIAPAVAQEPTDQAVTVTFLGTGTPSPNPERFGAATLIEADGQRLLFDAGRGVVIRLSQIGLMPVDLDAVFLTHFHSDHVVGLPDLFLSRVILDAGRDGRDTPLALYGPTGTGQIAEGLTSAFAADLETRRHDERVPANRMGFAVIEADAGVVYDEGGLRVTMFAVDHGEFIRPAVGYRIDYGESTIVLSGDTRFDPRIAEQAAGADLLAHETATADASVAATPRFARILDHHTAPADVGRIFAMAKPRLAVVSHIGLHGAVDESDVAAGIRTTYTGPLVIAGDLMQVTLGLGAPEVRLLPAR